MAVRQDPRLIVVVICAVALAYWLIVPHGRKEEVVILKGVQSPKNKDIATNGGEHAAHEGLGLGHLDHMHDTSHKDKEEGLKMENEEKEQLARLQKDFENAQTQIEQLKDELIAKEALLQQSKKQEGTKQLQKDAEKIAAPERKPFSGHMLIHLDLKGTAPRLSYLKELIPFVKKQGVTGMLIEYEDRFPFEGELSILKSKDAYTKKEIRELIGIAKDLDMVVIPLIQTFGHLEFVLKHEKYAHLRETAKITNSVCPLKNESRMLIKEIIRNVLKLHSNAKWIHLGGDEVWNIKTCDKCKESPMKAADIFRYHMLPLFEFVQKESNGKTIPIIWDDMMRSWKVDDLKTIAKYAEPMIWAYVPDLTNYYKFPDGMWERYFKAFPKVWAASSFKGADKPVSNYAPIAQHIQNHLSWMKIISTFPQNFQVIGIAITGWSRFDHYASMCELLPAAIPSLSFCLAVLHKGYFDDKLQKAVSSQLGFKKPLPISVSNFKILDIQAGSFPGNDVFELVSKYEKARGWFNSGKVREVGWAGPHQVETSHLSFYQLETAARSADVCIEMLSSLEPQAIKILSQYFSKEIVNEWINDKIKRTTKEAESMKANVFKIMEKAAPKT